MHEKHAKRAARLLLFLLLLDLATSPICSAGTLPLGSSDSTVSVAANPEVRAPLAQNSEDDGCFCCCTHILPGAQIFIASPVPLVAGASILILRNPLAPPQTLFHPPRL